MLSILKKAHFWALFTNKNFSIHKIKKMRRKKLPIGDPSDSRFISQNVPVIPDNLMEPITSKALSQATSGLTSYSKCISLEQSLSWCRFWSITNQWFYISFKIRKVLENNSKNAFWAHFYLQYTSCCLTIKLLDLLEELKILPQSRHYLYFWYAWQHCTVEMKWNIFWSIY